jgi:hypothetical protein
MFLHYVSGHFHIYIDEQSNMRRQFPSAVMICKHCCLYTDRVVLAVRKRSFYHRTAQNSSVLSY